MLSDLSGAGSPIARLTVSLVTQNNIVISAMNRTAGITTSNRRRPPILGIRKPSSSSVSSTSSSLSA